MRANEYQTRAMSTRLPSCEKKLNKYGNPVGSYFPDERYCPHYRRQMLDASLHLGERNMRYTRRLGCPSHKRG